MNNMDPFIENIRNNIICSDKDRGADLIAKYIVKVIQSGKTCRYYTEKFAVDEIDNELKKYNMDSSSMIMDGSLIINPVIQFYIDFESKKTDFSDSSIILEMNYIYSSHMIREDLFYYEGIIKDYFDTFKNGGLINYNIDRAGIDLIIDLINKNKDAYMYRVDGKIYTYDSRKDDEARSQTAFLLLGIVRERERVKKISDEAIYINNLLMELSYKKDERDIAYSALERVCSRPYADCGCITLLNDKEKQVINYNLSPEVLEIFLKKINKGRLEKVNCDIKNYGYSIYRYDEVLPENIEILQKNHIQSSIATVIKNENTLYGYMWLGSKNDTHIFEGNGEFLEKVSDAIGRLIYNYREYKKMLDTMVTYRKIQALGELSGGIAHEFNNILTPILGYIQILKSKIQDDSLSNYIQMIENSAIDGARIVRRIQDFTRKERKETEVVDIDKIISQSVEIMKPRWTNEAQINGRFINVSLELNSGGFVEGIETEMREIFINMISNSIDALVNGGEIKIKTTNKNGKIIITFEDNGEGITKENISKIFEPFFTTKKEKGNGLGLPVIYNIIKSMDGNIEAKSTRGVGTKFIIDLPLSKLNEAWKKATVDTENKYKYNILVIDDQPQVAETVYEMLKMMGHDAVFATNHCEAFEYFDKNNFDCVICDLAMPNITGIELCKHIKRLKSDIPFILMTGWPGKLKEEEINIIDGILQKPFSIEDISNILVCTMNKRG